MYTGNRNDKERAYRISSFGNEARIVKRSAVTAKRMAQPADETGIVTVTFFIHDHEEFLWQS